MCLSSKSQPHELESLQIHHRLHIDLQPPVKFHDVVPNGKPETKRDISKTEAPFLLEIPCLYMTHRPMKLHAIITNGT